MFDIGFPELLLISLVALLVIGPNELPNAIRAISLWIGRLKRNFSKIRQELEQEIGADEIRAQLYNEEVMREIQESKETLVDTQKKMDELIEDVAKDFSTDPKVKIYEHGGKKQ